MATKPADKKNSATPAEAAPPAPATETPAEAPAQTAPESTDLNQDELITMAGDNAEAAIEAAKNGGAGDNVEEKPYHGEPYRVRDQEVFFNGDFRTKGSVVYSDKGLPESLYVAITEEGEKLQKAFEAKVKAKAKKAAAKAEAEEEEEY